MTATAASATPAAGPAAGPAGSAGRPDRSDLRRAAHLFRRYAGRPRYYVLGVVLLAFEALTAVVEPYPIAYLIDFLEGAKGPLGGGDLLPLSWSPRIETIAILTAAVIAIAALNSAADSLTEVCMARGGRSLGYRIRVAMYSHLQQLPLAYHDRRRTGDVLTRVTGDVLVVEDFVVNSVSNILGSLMVLVGSFCFLAYQSWDVALLSLAVVPWLAVLSNSFSRRIKTASKDQRAREGELASTAQEMLTAIRLVQSYGRGTVDLQRFSDQTHHSMRASLTAANIQAQFSFVVAVFEALAICAVVWLGVVLLDQDRITIGTLVLFVLLLQNMFKPARKVVSEWYKIGKVFASVERIDDLLDRPSGVQSAPDAVPAPALEGRLTFRNVRFRYPVDRDHGGAPGPLVLDGIDFKVSTGEVVALVGSSGAGKSTIAQLVPRLYDPDDGEVLLDGTPVARFELASLRRQVSLVLQDTILLSGTVAENIGYGVDDPTQQGIEAAARAANAHDFIRALPDGYQTRLGERGATLSGGQRQRIAIARAFMRRAPVLILDEPTTGLDDESARSVVAALRSLMRGTTTLLVSHDRNLVECADRVLTISGGRILEDTREDDGAAALPLAGTAFSEVTVPDPVVAEPAFQQPAAPALVVPATDGAVPATDLMAALQQRLPALAQALDERGMAALLQRHLTGDEGVATVAAGKLWLRADHTLSLRYQVGMVDGAHQETVLARLLVNDAEADAYLGTALRRLTAVGSGLPAAAPWRASTAVVAGTGLALYRFPIDPDLPTLTSAVDPGVLRRLAGRTPHDETRRPDDQAMREGHVTVAHHPRQGPCVLLYTEAGRTLHGKVYAGDEGELVDGFLVELTRQHPGNARWFPKRVAYHNQLKLLLMEGAHTEPVLARLVRSASGTSARAAQDADRLSAAVAQAGQALAVLHGSDLTTAPAHRFGDEVAVLRAETDVVAAVWPDVADRVREQVERIIANEPVAPELVLSHGDLRPPRLLLDGSDSVMVDLDSLCWADPALDLGRFLASLSLLAAEHDEGSGHELTHRCAADFLAGYRDAGGRSATASGAVERIEVYGAMTLARCALQAARQLKAHRLHLAMSLLESLVDNVQLRRIDL